MDTTGDAAASNGVSISFQECTGGPRGNAYNDSALIPRDGPNGTFGRGADAPLGNRIPVILIHGIHGNRRDNLDSDTIQHPNYRYFQNLIGSLNLGGGATYNSAYKTYSFHYVSDRYTAQEIAQALRDRIDEICEFGDKPIIIVAHSMGGIVARHYLLQTTHHGTYDGQPAGERVQKLITLATPHHGTYGADLISRGDRFLDPGFANWLLGKGDVKFWHPTGCEACILDPQHVNRRTLLWDNYAQPYCLYPNEQPTDSPDTLNYNNKIIAYSGVISPNDPNWQVIKEAVSGPTGAAALIDYWDSNDKNLLLAVGAYVTDSIFLGRFNLQYIPDPQNDGLVPLDSARFSGATLMSSGRVHCPDHNHLQMELGGVGPCSDGKILFKSVRERIMGTSVVSPSLLVGPDSAGFGYQTYNVARHAGSLTIAPIDVELSNMGDASLQITSLSLAGDNPDQFAIVKPPALPLTIGAASTTHISVAFNPTSPGLKAADLLAGNSSANSVVSVHISGTGVPAQCDLNLSPANTFMPTSGGSGEIIVGNISCPWTVSAVDDWIHPTALADRVSFTVDANAAAAVRYGTIIVSVYGRSYLYSISQDAANAPCWLQLSSDQSVVQREAGGSSFYITAPTTCGWSFQSDSAWLVPSVATLQGSGSVGFTVADNFGLDRDGVITIQGASTSAQFTVHQRGASASGTVTYGNAAAPPKYISNVTVSGAGSPNVSTTTAAPGGSAGQYTLTGFGAGSYTVSLSKTTGQNSITSNDAARVAQHVASTSPLTTNNQKVAADVSGNGAISSQDAAKIAQVVAGLPLSPPNLTGTWRFFVPPGPTFPVGSSPTSRTYASVASNLTGEDYIGLLMGDVTGNWTPSAARPAGRNVRVANGGPEIGIEVDLPQVESASGKEVVVPVNVAHIADKNVISYEFDLRYDPSVIQPAVDVVDVKDSASRGLSVVTNATEPGILRVVVYGAMPITENGVLLNLRFVAVGSAGSVSPLTFERIIFNEGESRVSVVDGQVQLF